MLKEKSKYLSMLLRHKPEKAHLDLDKEGWCSMHQLTTNTGLTYDEVHQIVKEDEKMRYSIRTFMDGEKIRANQGHSVKDVDIKFMGVIPPTILYHGTATKLVLTLAKEGIKPMSRQYVHLSKDEATAEQVGGRRGQFTVLRIDVKKMVEDGIKFYLSENGVYLTEYVDPKYIITQART